VFNLIQKKNTIFLKTLILLTLLTAPNHASQGAGEIKIILLNGHKYISLFEFIETFKTDNSYDIIFQRGRLYHRGKTAVYQSGYSIMLINGSLEKAEYPVTRLNGEFLLPLKLFEILVSRFYPDIELDKRDTAYMINRKEPERAPEIPAKEPIEPQKYSSRDRIGFIIIDPGHGGKDPGAIGIGKKKEKTITLAVSKYLESFLREKAGGIRIRMTRKSDIFIELDKRTETANKLLKTGRNGLFISIHVNASISNRMSGFETYLLSLNPTNEEARATSALENNVIVLEDKFTGKKHNDVEYVEALMMTTQLQKESSMLAETIQSNIDKKISESRSRGVKKADFFVLRGALMPAVLVETGYISNSKESGFLSRKEYQKRIADGIGEGIIGFIRKYNRSIRKSTPDNDSR
jgi:N-acetylmuramoyl-L-alanine amidase